YEAESTKRTLFNPTNHVYFNLNRDNNVVDNHRMSSSSLKMYTLDDENIVTGDEPLNFSQIFEDEHILFKDIFDSTNQKLQEQMQRYK
ncbi:galactose mutarotase, partial [Staphylococcus epidermidis]